MTRQVAYKGRQLISGLKLFATVYKTLKKKSSLISILHSVSPVQVYNIGQLVFCLQPSTYVSPHKHLQHEAEAIQEERVTRAAIFKRLACNSSIWFDLSHHLPATWPSLTLWLMGLMMFEVMAMLLVTTARMIIVAANALPLRFVIPWTSLQKNRVLDSKLT